MKDMLPNPLRALLVLLLTPLTAHAFENDFSAYPSGSQSCLSKSADSSGCTGDTGAEMNSCLCTNGGNFIYNVASCVAKESPSDLKTVYATLQNNCDGTGVIITVGEAAFLAQASAATETTATATPTTTTTASTTATATTTTASTMTDTTTSKGTATATSGQTGSGPTSTDGSAASDGDDGSSSGSLSTGAKIGIGAGIAIGGIACILGAVFIWIYNRRRRPSTKAYTQTGDGSPGPEEYSSAFGSGTLGGTQGQHSPYPPNSAIPLSASTGWAGGGTMNTVSSMGTQSTAADGGLFYKPQDAQQTSQPLLAAELGTEQPRGPVELYAPHQPPDAGSHLTPGFRAELPGGDVPQDRYQSPPGSHSPYSPPYERSHF